MHPLLFQVGELRFFSYGLMMALGFLAAVQWAALRASRYGVSKDFMSSLSILMVVAGIVGGRLGYFISTGASDEIFSPKVFEVWTGGMVFYGGFFLAFAASLFYCRMKSIPAFRVGDIIAPPLAIGHLMGRIGCFLAGCCYGRQCDLPWAVVFKDPLSLAPRGVHLHPTQLYEALGQAILIGIMLLVQRRQKFEGQIFVVYLVGYAILRVVVEALRGDIERGFITFGGAYPNEWLSTSTLISVVILALAAVVYWNQRAKPVSR